MPARMPNQMPNQMTNQPTPPAAGYSLAELCVCAWLPTLAGLGEVLASGMGVIPRLAVSLAMRTVNPGLMVTNSEAMLLSEPNPLGERDPDFVQASEAWMGFSHVFDIVWSGRRHAILGPVQIDRFGQSNTSALGGAYRAPKTMLLGPRGFPGNSICHSNSFFVPAHSRRVFVSGECDFVCSIGYNPARLPRGHSLDDIDISLIVTDLCVMDFGGPGHQARLRSLHPGIGVEQVQDNTGFPLLLPDPVPLTAAPTPAQLALIAELDPHRQRDRQIADNPTGDRRPQP